MPPHATHDRLATVDAMRVLAGSDAEAPRHARPEESQVTPEMLKGAAWAFLALALFFVGLAMLMGPRRKG